MKRKQFLMGMAASGTLASIGGCNPFADSNRLRILGLSGSLPSKVVNQFEKQLNKSAELKAAKNLPELWKSLQELSKTEDADKIPDVIGIGDGWLDDAIAQSLIQPLTNEQLTRVSEWQKLDKRWQQLVTRQGQVWGIPYRWGTTAIAYLPEKVKFEIKSWADLWQPQLKRRLTLPDDAREVIGLVLKKLGNSYQSADLSAIKNLETELAQLHQQVLIYSSDNYLQPLLTDDAWVAVGWSQDMYKTQQQNPEVKVVIPQEGTALWADIWALPKQQKRPNNLAFAYDWMNFCLQPAIAAQITSFTEAATTSASTEQIPESVKANIIKFPSAQILSQSEVLLPLSTSTAKQYQDLWRKVRSQTFS